jgi:hypothetical protein
MIRKPEFETRANSFQSLRLQCGSRSAATCKRIQMKRKNTTLLRGPGLVIALYYQSCNGGHRRERDFEGRPHCRGTAAAAESAQTPAVRNTTRRPGQK